MDRAQFQNCQKIINLISSELYAFESNVKFSDSRTTSLYLANSTLAQWPHVERSEQMKRPADSAGRFTIAEIGDRRRYGANMNGVTTSTEVRSTLAVCVVFVGTCASSVYFAATDASEVKASVVAPAE